VDRAQRLVDWTAAPNDITLLGDAYSSLGAKRALPAQDDLTPEAKKQNRNRILKRTAEEEQRDLAALPGGQETLAKNRARAESLYRQAIQKAPQLPEPHRGLGMLYEDESKDADALAEYTQYLTLAPPGAMDRLRIERRLVKLQNGTATK
jgi:Flp pilus assembly protein TadD